MTLTSKLYLRNGGWEKYVQHGIWIGEGNETCTDPELLYDSLMINPVDLIYGIQYTDFEENESLFYECEFKEQAIKYTIKYFCLICIEM